MIKDRQKENIKDVINDISELMEEMRVALEKIIRLLR
jgi:hypothetical protein|tara:strand:- start:434 stop:544 length:111 start_codon:yes stop_codon:yes gene_type:complete